MERAPPGHFSGSLQRESRPIVSRPPGSGEGCNLGISSRVRAGAARMQGEAKTASALFVLEQLPIYAPAVSVSFSSFCM